MILTEYGSPASTMVSSLAADMVPTDAQLSGSAPENAAKSAFRHDAFGDSGSPWHIDCYSCGKPGVPSGLNKRDFEVLPSAVEVRGVCVVICRLPYRDHLRVELDQFEAVPICLLSSAKRR